jgi:hypothetical protein
MLKGRSCLVVGLATLIAACGPSSSRGGVSADAHSGSGSGGGGGSDGTGGGYLVYAHSDTVLYSIDLSSKSLVTVGKFNAGSSMTDLAVAPDGTIYTISKTALYTVNPQTAQATQIGSLATCGTYAVALTTTSDGRMWTGDHSGAICQIDISVTPPVVKPPVTMQNGLALTGDMVGIGDGTVFGTAYKLSDTTGGTTTNNLLVKIDVTTGAVTQVGATGYPQQFGIAFQENQVFGFTYDGTGRVVTIDPNTGMGTTFGTFMDPATNKGITFAGAGVNSLIVIQ